MGNVIGHEACCTKCGETFQPADEIDALEHVQREDGTACGGLGQMVGSWSAEETSTDIEIEAQIPGKEGWEISVVCTTPEQAFAALDNLRSNAAPGELYSIKGGVCDVCGAPWPRPHDPECSEA